MTTKTMKNNTVVNINKFPNWSETSSRQLSNYSWYAHWNKYLCGNKESPSELVWRLSIEKEITKREKESGMPLLENYPFENPTIGTT